MANVNINNNYGTVNVTEHHYHPTAEEWCMECEEQMRKQRRIVSEQPKLQASSLEEEVAALAQAVAHLISIIEEKEAVR